ncbi:Vacuolar protein sorting-associated protein 16B [Sergentomyia squamirostris]
MNSPGEEEDYWNVSDSKAYNFDEDDVSNISEASYEDFPQSDFPLSLLISDQDLQMILEEQSRQEILPRNISQEEELRVLRRKFQEERNPPPASVIISRLLTGRQVQLENYKTLPQKTELLDEAMVSGSGDAILKVVLFLTKTLKKKIVHQLLQNRPEAVNHYTNYLSTRLQISDCVDLWTMLGKQHEAAMFQFRLAVTTSNVDQKRRKLAKVHSDYFVQPGGSSFHARFLLDVLNLLEYQSTDVKECLDKPALETLYHVCQKHRWTDNKTPTPGNPYNFAKLYQISASQFEWIVLNERGRSKAWRDLDALFEKKTFIKSTFSIHIPLDKVVIRLHQLEAPTPVLNTFLSKIDDTQKRLILARKVEAVRTVIDCLVALKEKGDLLTVRNGLEPGTPDRFYADNCLESLQNSKWKADSIKVSINKK